MYLVITGLSKYGLTDFDFLTDNSMPLHYVTMFPRVVSYEYMQESLFASQSVLTAIFNTFNIHQTKDCSTEGH